MTTRALVLAGGGVTGIGWELGVMFGLRDAGVDVLDWDLVVGTSAGAVVGAALGRTGDLDALGIAFGTMDGARLRQLLTRRDMVLATAIDDLWFGPQASADGPDGATRWRTGPRRT